MSLNIERVQHLHLSLKIGARYIKQFRRIVLNNLKTYLITKNVMQQFRSFRILLVSLLFLKKNLKIATIAQVNRLFPLLNLIFSTGEVLHE